MLQPLGFLFLGQYNIESIKALVIASELKSELEQLYKTSSKID